MDRQPVKRTHKLPIIRSLAFITKRLYALLVDRIQLSRTPHTHCAALRSAVSEWKLTEAFNAVNSVRAWARRQWTHMKKIFVHQTEVNYLFCFDDRSCFKLIIAVIIIMILLLPSLLLLAIKRQIKRNRDKPCATMMTSNKKKYNLMPWSRLKSFDMRLKRYAAHEANGCICLACPTFLWRSNTITVR